MSERLDNQTIADLFAENEQLKKELEEKQERILELEEKITQLRITLRIHGLTKEV